MKQVQAGLMVALLAMSVYLGGCASHSNRVEHYRSAQVEGEQAKINLDEVQKAFWESRGKDNKDFDGWMQNFEKRVNEIYEGKDVVSIDATRENGKLVVTGYIDKLKQDGFKPGDEKLFSIEQTGDPVNNEMPYTVNTGYGTPYYTGHHSLLDSPVVQFMLLSHMMGGWGGRYYTPYPRTVILVVTAILSEQARHTLHSKQTTPASCHVSSRNRSVAALLAKPDLAQAAPSLLI